MKIIAHRGASSLLPENTLLSLEHVLDMGIDMVEVDVRQSRDGEIVVFHDYTLDRTTNGTGRVKDKTLSELKKLDAGQGERIPLLSEVLRLAKSKLDESNKVYPILIVEIKELGIERMVMDIIKQEKMVNNVIVASFYHHVSLNLKSMNEKLKTGIIFIGQPIYPEKMAIDARAEYMLPFHSYLSEKMVLNAHKHNIKVYTGVVDTGRDMESVSRMGVDGVVTNKLLTMSKSH
jgi:glycerophosphoryl diester phosphodiesterase